MGSYTLIDEPQTPTSIRFSKLKKVPELSDKQNPPPSTPYEHPYLTLHGTSPSAPTLPHSTSPIKKIQRASEVSNETYTFHIIQQLLILVQENIQMISMEIENCIYNI